MGFRHLPLASKVSTQLATTSDTSVTSKVQATGVPGQQSAVQPALQRQDGNFIGTVSTSAGNSMIAFSPSGSILFTVANDVPQIATSDNGVVGASGTTYDHNGNVSGKLATLSTPSWTGNSYQLGSVEQVVDAPVEPAVSFEAYQGGNPSTQGTSVTTISFQKHIDTDNPPQNEDFADVSLHGIALSQTESVLVTL